MKKTLMILAIFLVACTAPQAIIESPGQVTPPATTPAPTTPVTTPTTTETAPVTTPTGDCQTDCESRCYPNSVKVCGQGTSYNNCVTNCGDLLRPTGCKAACATESDKECTLVFESQCRRECRDTCPATA